MVFNCACAGCLQGISQSRNRTIYSRKMKESECEELDCHNARFGFALANAQDVDGDGYTGIHTVLQTAFTCISVSNWLADVVDSVVSVHFFTN